MSFGPVAGKYEGTVLGLDIGCFGELSSGYNDIYIFNARNRAVSLGRYDAKSPEEALGMFLKDQPRVGSCGRFRSRLSACSRPPPAPRARVATQVITSRTITFSTPHPRTPDAAAAAALTSTRPIVAGELGRHCQALVSRIKCEGLLVGSVVVCCMVPTMGSENTAWCECEYMKKKRKL